MSAYNVRLTTEDYTRGYTVDHGQVAMPPKPLFAIGFDFVGLAWHGCYFNANDTPEKVAERLEQLAADIRAGGRVGPIPKAVNEDEFRKAGLLDQ